MKSKGMIIYIYISHTQIAFSTTGRHNPISTPKLMRQYGNGPLSCLSGDVLGLTDKLRACGDVHGMMCLQRSWTVSIRSEMTPPMKSITMTSVNQVNLDICHWTTGFHLGFQIQELRRLHGWSHKIYSVVKCCTRPHKIMGGTTLPKGEPNASKYWWLRMMSNVQISTSCTFDPICELSIHSWCKPNITFFSRAGAKLHIKSANSKNTSRQKSRFAPFCGVLRLFAGVLRLFCGVAWYQKKWIWSIKWNFCLKVLKQCRLCSNKWAAYSKPCAASSLSNWAIASSHVSGGTTPDRRYLYTETREASDQVSPKGSERKISTSVFLGSTRTFCLNVGDGLCWAAASTKLNPNSLV